MKGKTVEERLSDYSRIRQEALELYNTFGKVACPALGQDIHFTSNGFNHLIYERAKKERDKRAQILRFDLLSKAKFILEQSTTFQEFEEKIEWLPVNRQGKTVSVNQFVKTWGFVAVVQKFRIKVVATQVGNGKIEFFSVIPAWITRYYRNIKMIENSVGSGLLNDNDEEVLKNITS